MGHTNTTPNYNLPQFLGSDKPAWLTDVNNAMSAIDTAIAAAKAAADNAGGAAAALATTVGGHTTQLETLSGTVANQGATIVSQGNAINTISELIGNGTPTTTDHTLIGAINEINAKVERGSVSVTADGVKTFSQLFNELYAATDMSKVTINSKLVEIGTGYEVVYNLVTKNTASGAIVYCKNDINVNPDLSRTNMASLKAAGSTLYESASATTPAVTITDQSSAVPAAGAVYKLNY